MPEILCKRPGGYVGTRPGLTEPWDEGACRSVSAEDAEYLLRTFPNYFDRMARPDEAVTPESGPAPVLESTVRDLLPAIRAGEFDDRLAPMLAAERAGENRSTVCAALEARARAVADSVPLADEDPSDEDASASADSESPSVAPEG